MAAVDNTMRILIAIPSFYAGTGGAEAFAVSITKKLTRRGHDIHVVATEGETGDGITLRIGNLPEEVRRAREEMRPDVVVDWGLNVEADLHRLGGGVHAPYLAKALSAYPVPLRPLKALAYHLAPKHRRTVAREMRFLCRPGARFLAVSHLVAHDLARTVRLESSRIHVLHNGVDTRRFHPFSGDRRRTARERLGLEHDQVAFVMAAHNLRLKNFVLVRRVFDRLFRVLPEIRLVLVGKRRPHCRAPWLIYPGATRKPEEIFAAADGMVHPTYYDACANVVLEGLACGLPVLSSNRNGSAEIITHRQNGFVLPVCGKSPEITPTWADLVEQLARDSTWRQKVGMEARELAERHSLDEYARDLEAILGHIAADKAAGKRAEQGPSRNRPGGRAGRAGARERGRHRFGEGAT